MYHNYALRIEERRNFIGYLTNLKLRFNLLNLQTSNKLNLI